MGNNTVGPKEDTLQEEEMMEEKMEMEWTKENDRGKRKEMSVVRGIWN